MSIINLNIFLTNKYFFLFNCKKYFLNVKQKYLDFSTFYSNIIKHKLLKIFVLFYIISSKSKNNHLF